MVSARSIYCVYRGRVDPQTDLLVLAVKKLRVLTQIMHAKLVMAIVQYILIYDR